MKILIIEDELLILKSLQKLVSKKGHDVTALSGGHEAINQILENDFDRIVCDLMLQDITGIDIIEASKKKYTSDEISNKFIIMTAYTSEHVLGKAGNYNCPILAKPFDDIIKVVDDIILKK